MPRGIHKSPLLAAGGQSWTAGGGSHRLRLEPITYQTNMRQQVTFRMAGLRKRSKMELEERTLENSLWT